MMTDMTTMVEMARAVLAAGGICRCSAGYDEDTGEYAPGACESDATHSITGPHGEDGDPLCEACARKIHADIPYNHRWHLGPIRGVQGLIAARILARAVLATGDETTETAETARLRALVADLVAEMKRWGAEGDGVPEGCRAFDQAVALLAAAGEVQP